MDYDNTNSGVMFLNDKDGNEKRPDYTGKLNVNGEDFAIAAWNRTGKSGTEFLSIKISEPREQKSGLDKAREVRQSLNKPDEVHEFDEDEPIDLESIPF